MARKGVHELSIGSSGGFETYTLSSAAPRLAATFAPRAGMIGCSLEHGGDELLHQGEGLGAYVQQKQFMGIPLLHPWANRLGSFDYAALGKRVSLDRGSPLLQRDDNGLPIHGVLARCPDWRIVRADAAVDGAVVVAELDYGAHEELLAAFPFPHVLRIELHLEGRELAFRTTVTANGDTAVPVSFGYHPYFRMPGVPREQWEIELPVRERLVLDERMIPTGRSEPVEFRGAPLGDRAFDDAFADLVPGRPFVLAGGERALEVEFGEHYPFAQVYSPAGASFICFEPMTAPTNALASGAHLPVVGAGEQLSAAFCIRLSAR